MKSQVPRYFYRSCFSYFTKTKMKIDLDSIAKEVYQQKVLLNSPQSKNIDEFLKKFQKMKSINQDYELMQQTHKDYPSLASFQMSRTLDMEKTSRRVGQVHKSQKNNIENMNKSTKTIQLLKNELYELYFQLENKKYDLKSTMNEMVKLKSFLNEHNQNAYSSNNHQEIIDQQMVQVLQSGETLVDVQGQVKAIRSNGSQILKEVQNIKNNLYEIFRAQGYTVFDNTLYNFQRCQYPINTMFTNEYKFIEISSEEKEYLCLNSSIPGLLSLAQSRINIPEKFKIIVITPIINTQLNGISDAKIEIISEVDNASSEEEIIQLLKLSNQTFLKLFNIKSSFKIEGVKDDSKSHLTLQMQEGNLMTLRSYGNFISKRMNLKLKQYIEKEEFEEVSCLNVIEIPSLLSLYLYKLHAEQQSK